MQTSLLASNLPHCPDSPSGVFLSYQHPPGAADGRLTTPRLLMSLGGRAVTVTMDTRSTGIVVLADAIPEVNERPSRPAHVAYTSSGRVMHGRWVRTPAHIEGAGGIEMTTHPIKVLAVSRMSCLEKARDCTPGQDPAGIAVMGVGFAREQNLQPEGTPGQEPLSELDGAAGRRARLQMIDDRINEWTGGRSAESVMSALQGVGVSAGVVKPVWTVLDDPHYRRRQFFTKISRAYIGEFLATTPWFRAPQEAVAAHRPPPTLGEHNSDVFSRVLKMSAAQQQELERAGIIGSTATRRAA